VGRIGWFDERLLGVGNEDEDYEARLELNGVSIESFRITSVDNLVFETKDFSFGANVRTVKRKYSSVNKDFFDQKWSVNDTPKEGFVWVPILNAYAKLNDGMETPDFYPLIREKIND
jgi:hypothetical protein